MNSFTKTRIFLEKNGFNVATRLAERLGLRVKYVRLFFIYISFILGAGIVFCVCFFTKNKRLNTKKKKFSV